MLIEPQEWENLAVAEGVRCTAPEMIDGNLKTVGYAKGRWIHLTFPTRKSIHRIVIRGTNITKRCGVKAQCFSFGMKQRQKNA
jgi:hypothetical protein